MKKYIATYDVWSFAFGMAIPFRWDLAAASPEEAVDQVKKHNGLAENIRIQET